MPRNSWLDGVDPCDLPYGPGNADYEYDKGRAERDEEEVEEPVEQE